MSTLYKFIIAIGLLVAAATFAVNWYDNAIEQATDNGKKIERAEWQKKETKRKADEVLALREALEKDRLTQLENDAKNRKVSEQNEKAQNALKTKISSLDAALAAAGGLRIPRSIFDPVASPAQTTGNGDHDAYLARTVKLPDWLARNLQSEADRADEIVEQARECQNWVIEHGFYGPPPKPVESAGQPLAPNNGNSVLFRIEAPTVQESTVNQLL